MDLMLSDNYSENDIFWIDKPNQLKLLTSPIRVAIIDSIATSQTCSISDLAINLGVPADSLYYHIKKLASAGLIIEKGIQETSRRDEVVYCLPEKKNQDKV